MALIAIDMTPVLPGGENGGAKLLAIELLRGFQAASRNNKFLILTASSNDEELSAFDGPNMQRLCIMGKNKDKMLSLIEHFPDRIQTSLLRTYRSIRRQYKTNPFQRGILAARGVDLLFCPFTAPTFAESGIPVISLIHDLQHKDYPQFFSRQEIDLRDAFMDEVCRRADAILCVSESTRASVITHLKTDPDKTYSIHNCIQSRLLELDPSQISQYLKKLNIDSRPYMFYPANFWPHKNHQMLITAYGMYVALHPESEIDLVFTGALDNAKRDLMDKVRRMGLEKRVHFLGYLPDEQLTAVWAGCSFLVFPSLYEGFGIPVLEAMQFGKPVLCSNLTSLPEVAGNAALYFDPRKPHEIVQSMENIIGNQELYADLVKRGYERLSHFQSEEMVKKYLQCMEEVMGFPRQVPDEIKGVYGDNWTGNELVITQGYEPGRMLELVLEVPSWVPYERVTVSLKASSGKKQTWTIDRGENYEIRLPLLETGEHLLFSIEPHFIPSECNMGADDRCLSVFCRKCRIVCSDGEQTVLWSGKKL